MKLRYRLASLLLWGLAMLSACQPPNHTPMPPTLTKSTVTTPTPSPTAGDWFPPTATPTPLPTPFFTPTPDLAAGKGSLRWSASFSDPKSWWTPTELFGTLGLSDGVLTITGTRAHMAMLVFAHRDAGYNFYLEATARPTICRGKDAYGIIFRATPHGNSFYLFGANCEGYALVEKVTGQLAVPQADPQPAPIPPGGLGEVTFSVLAVKRQIYLAVNGQPIFAVRDDGGEYDRRGVGLFVRPESNNGATVVFSKLNVYAANPLAAGNETRPSPTP